MRLPALIILPLTLALSSCVYFNVFYNANKYFKQARTKQLERMRNAPDTAIRVVKEEEDLYAKSIEKCSKVLKVYPQNRKYNARATLLLGEIYYCEGKYPEGIRKFNEFLTNYTGHPQQHRAIYLKAMCYYEQGDLQKAGEGFETVADKAPDGELRTRARYMMAEISLLKGSSFQAIDQLKKMEGGGRAFQSLINFKMGNLLFIQKNYARAYKQFMAVERIRLSRKLPEISVPEDIKYEADIMAGRCLRENGEIRKAIAHFEALLENDAYFRKFSEIEIHLANCLIENKEHEKAKKILLKIVEAAPKTPQSASACYHMGLLYENVFHDMREAFSYYRRAFTECDQCGESLLAKNRYEGLRAIMFLEVDLDSLLARDTSLTREDSAVIDSVRKMDLVVRYFKVAEIYLYRLSRGDSAVIQYRRVLALDSAADTASLRMGKMKALYAVAWISKNLLQQQETADSLFREIVARYPATEYAKAAELSLGGPPTIMTHADSVTGAFLAAESLYTFRNDCRAAVNGFDAFVKARPSERLAPKAILAAGWLCENCLYDNDAAEKYYQTLNDDFKTTEYGRFARRKLEGKKAELEEIFIEKPGQGPEGTVLSESIARKMKAIGDKVPEAGDEGAWVKLSSLTAVNGKMEGKLRSQEALMEEFKPAIESIDETYIDMVEDDLNEEGDFAVQVSIKKNGEVSKVKIERDKSKIQDKTLTQEIEKILYGMIFAENAAEDIVVQLNLKFTKKSTSESPDDEE